MRKIFIQIILLCFIPVSIMAESGIATSLFSGRMSYTIPLYTIDDVDFHLDITLRYNGNGFKPFQPSGCYGQDWTLTAGGCITRSVQGLADEQICTNDGDSLLGMLRFLQISDIPDKNDVYTMSSSICDTCGLLFIGDNVRCGHNVDYLPDIFYFNFCGYKGRFIINNQGKASIISGDFVKVDFSNFHDDTSYSGGTNSYPNADSYITVKTMDGYTYVFGGTLESIEYSVLTNRNSNIQQVAPAASAWHLTQIIAPSGRSIALNYKGQSNRSLQSFITDYDWTEKSSDTIHITYLLHKECLLQSITTSDSIPLTVQFHSHVESSPMYENNDFTYCKPHCRLDSIRVLFKNEILKTARLSYQYRSTYDMWGAYPNYHWRYLSQVDISGVGKYTMSYNNIGTPLAVFTYPALYPQTDAAYKNKVDRFGYWKQTSLQGMLYEVSLPTGGKVRFTYGTHQYRQERRFYKVGSDADIVSFSLYATNSLSIGGARIEKIERFSDANTRVDSKTFYYNLQGSENSSGIFYNIYELFDSSNSSVSHPIVNPNNYGMIDSHVGYSYVVQMDSIDTIGYKTAYTFNTGNSYYTSVNSNTINRRTDMPWYDATTEVRSGSLTYPEKLQLTGKLMSIDQYTGGTLDKTTLFEYNGISNPREEMTDNPEVSLGCTDTIVVMSKYSGLIARKLYIFPDVMEKSVTLDYERGNTPMVIDKTYTHDLKLRKKKEVLMDSQGVPHFTKYTYPDNFTFSIGFLPPSQQPALYLLKQAYRINAPIEVVSGYTKNNVEYITSGQISVFAKGQYLELHPNGQMFVLKYYPYLSQTLSLDLSSPITNYAYMACDGSSVSYDSRYRMTCEYMFNPCNRLVSVSPFGTNATTYTWNKRDDIYPTSKTVGNLTYSYTYKPYIGVSSTTDPMGIITYYIYDAVGRLIEEYQIINGKKQILNAYHYHTKTE